MFEVPLGVAEDLFCQRPQLRPRAQVGDAPLQGRKVAMAKVDHALQDEGEIDVVDARKSGRKRARLGLPAAGEDRPRDAIGQGLLIGGKPAERRLDRLLLFGRPRLRLTKIHRQRAGKDSQQPVEDGRGGGSDGRKVVRQV